MTLDDYIFANSNFPPNAPTYSKAATTVTAIIQGKNALTRPPYNFVQVDGCECGFTSAQADAFIGTVDGCGATDQACLLWRNVVQDSQVTVNWSNHVLQNLQNGEKLADAARDAGNAGMPAAPGGINAAYVPYGDSNMNLHGVYLGAGLAWMKHLRLIYALTWSGGYVAFRH